MAKRKRSTGSCAGGYEVGYGKPPKETQFRKGQSGNPKGRPKGSRNLFTRLSSALIEKVSITENGRRKTITKWDAACKQLANRSAAGDLAAARLVLSVLSQVESNDQAVGLMLTPEMDQALAKSLLARLTAVEDHREDEPK